MLADRVLDLEGIHNFRDYGGYTSRSGGALKRGLLWRSSQHRDATDEDLNSVAAIGLGTVVDLRGESERADNPCRRHDGFDGTILFAPGETAGAAVAPHIAAAIGLRNGADGANALKGAYAEMPWRENLVTAFRHYFDAIEQGRPTLVHCFAGKDRTGLIVAVFHHLMGVDEADMVADYMLTNSAGKVEARIEAGAKHIRERYGVGLSDAGIRAMMMVREDYLLDTFASIIARNGSIESYAESVLGVSPQRAERLRGIYLD